MAAQSAAQLTPRQLKRKVHDIEAFGPVSHMGGFPLDPLLSQPSWQIAAAVHPEPEPMRASADLRTSGSMRSSLDLRPSGGLRTSGSMRSSMDLRASESPIAQNSPTSSPLRAPTQVRHAWMMTIIGMKLAA